MARRQLQRLLWFVELLHLLHLVSLVHLVLVAVELAYHRESELLIHHPHIILIMMGLGV